MCAILDFRALKKTVTKVILVKSIFILTLESPEFTSYLFVGG